jgi:hypothetical protein
MELPDAIVYRRAYGLAGARSYGMASGRAHSSKAAGGDGQALLAEVLRRLNVGQGATAEVVREAVAGRRPQW